MAEAMGVSLSTVNPAHMAYDDGGLTALKSRPSGGRKRENMKLSPIFDSSIWAPRRRRSRPPARGSGVNPPGKNAALFHLLEKGEPTKLSPGMPNSSRAPMRLQAIAAGRWRSVCIVMMCNRAVTDGNRPRPLERDVVVEFIPARAGHRRLALAAGGRPGRSELLHALVMASSRAAPAGAVEQGQLAAEVLQDDLLSCSARPLAGRSICGSEAGLSMGKPSSLS